MRSTKRNTTPYHNTSHRCRCCHHLYHSGYLHASSIHRRYQHSAHHASCALSCSSCQARFGHVDLETGVKQAVHHDRKKFLHIAQNYIDCESRHLDRTSAYDSRQAVRCVYTVLDVSSCHPLAFTLLGSIVCHSFLLLFSACYLVVFLIPHLDRAAHTRSSSTSLHCCYRPSSCSVLPCTSRSLSILT